MRGLRVRAALIVATSALGLAACGSDNSSSSVATGATTTTPATTLTSSAPATASAALCSARDDLRASVEDLQNIDLVKNGTSGVTAALTKVKDSLAAVRAEAGADLQPQITAFEDALTRSASAASESNAAALATGVTDLVKTGTTLLTGLGQLSCS